MCSAFSSFAGFFYHCGNPVLCVPLCDKEKSSAKATFGSDLAAFLFLYNGKCWKGRIAPLCDLQSVNVIDLLSLGPVQEICFSPFAFMVTLSVATYLDGFDQDDYQFVWNVTE